MLINVILSENTNTTNDECQCKLSYAMINIYLQLASILFMSFIGVVHQSGLRELHDLSLSMQIRNTQTKTKNIN